MGKKQIFLSWARHTKDYADAIAVAIDRTEYAVWKYDMNACAEHGSTIQATIQRQIRRSHAALFLIDNTIATIWRKHIDRDPLVTDEQWKLISWVREEFELASEQARENRSFKIVPVCIAGMSAADLPIDLRRYRGCQLPDINELREREIQDFVRRIMREGSDDTDPASPASQAPLVYEVPRAQKKLVSILIRCLVLALVETLGDRRVGVELQLLESDLNAVLRGATYLLDTERLRRLSSRCDVFRDRDGGAKYLFVGGPPTIRALAQKKELVNGESDGGGRLGRYLDQLIERLSMVRYWRSIVTEQQKSLNSGLRREAITALHRIYVQAQLWWTPDEMDLFVESDFENGPWANIIDKSQQDLSPEGQTHLHRANEVIGAKLGAAFVRELRERDGHEIWLLEGGVGGANTTHQVVKAIIEQFGERSDKLKIKYCGYEINKGFARHADAILRGNDPPGRQAAGDPSQRDARSEFFKKVRANFSPIFRAFVLPRDMEVALNDLGRDVGYERFHAFFCSYTFHHIPNGRSIREFLSPGLEGVVGINDEARARRTAEIVAEVILHWSNKRCLPADERLLGQEKTARVVLSYLPFNFPSKEKEILALMRALRSRASGVISHDLALLVERLIGDPQIVFLHRVKAMLRPGGYLAIADPDGYSRFNLANVPHNAEMGVAHFRSVRELRSILETDLQFEIVDAARQIKVLDSGSPAPRFLEIPDKASRSELSEDRTVLDDNLGYLVIARKPVSQERTVLDDTLGFLAGASRPDLRPRVPGDRPVPLRAKSLGGSR